MHTFAPTLPQPSVSATPSSSPVNHERFQVNISSRRNFKRVVSKAEWLGIKIARNSKEQGCGRTVWGEMSHESQDEPSIYRRVAFWVRVRQWCVAREKQRVERPIADHLKQLLLRLREKPSEVQRTCETWCNLMQPDAAWCSLSAMHFLPSPSNTAAFMPISTTLTE